MSIWGTLVTVLLLILPALSQVITTTCEIPSVEEGDNATITIYVGEDLIQKQERDFILTHLDHNQKETRMLECVFTNGDVKCDKTPCCTWENKVTDVFRVYIHNASQQLEGKFWGFVIPADTKYQKYCSFTLKASTCPTDPINATNSHMTCDKESVTIGQSCTVTCNSDHYFQQNQISVTYTCVRRNKWSPEIPVTSCEVHPKDQNLYFLFLLLSALPIITLIVILFKRRHKEKTQRKNKEDPLRSADEECRYMTSECPNTPQVKGNEATVTGILSRTHTLDGSHQKIRLCAQTASYQDTPEEFTTVAIRDYNPSTSAETFLNYFENTRRSGGGPVADIKKDHKNKVVFVTFEDAEVAAKVANQDHQLEGWYLKIQVEKPPGMMKDRDVNSVLLNDDEILNFVETNPQLDEETFMFGADEGGAMDFLNEDIERDITIRASSTKRNGQTINITICEGDIAKQKIDVIVNSTSCELNLRSGAVTAAILAQGGASLQTECRMKYPKGIRIGDIARTSGHGLKCKEVFHVAIDNYKSAADEKKLLNIVLQCLEEASQSEYTSIAFPALGSGILGYPRNVVSRTMIKAFNYFRTATTSTCISDIKVVIWKDLQTIKEFQTEIIKYGMQITERSPSLSIEHDNVSLQSFSSHELSTSGKDFKPLTKYTGCFECKIDGMHLLVKQGDITEEDVDAIVNSSNDAFDLNIVTEMQAKGVCVTEAFNMKCRYILHLSSNRFHTDWQAGIKAILKVAEGLEINKIAFPALGTGRYTATSEILAEAMFRALIRFHQSHTDTELEVRVVLFDSDMIPPFVSQIEAQVTSAKVKTTKLWKCTLFKGKRDVSSLSKLITTNNNLQEREISVTLPEMKSILPTFWADQGRDQKLKICPLSDKEFKTVEKNFRASLGQAKINIVSIKRIQNPGLYMHYMIKKREMESQNADIPGIPNEKTLWHGTHGGAISNINHHGFNRSYCGKNATAYGEGVYFAVSSAYSASPKYSPPDSKGRRYIYQCKVLTGKAMIGKSALKVLPPRSGNILYDSATNSLTEPTLYVIFNDNQAYPEYLITFTNKDSMNI